MISTQVKPALDTKGNLVGPDAVNPKYGTPKCEFHCQLAKLPGGGWVGAHPSLGERAAVALLQRSPVLGDVWTGARAKAEIRREVTGPRGQDMRADFVVSGSGKDCVLEVKTVVDTDQPIDCIAVAASLALSAVRHRIEAQPSGEITE